MYVSCSCSCVHCRSFITPQQAISEKKALAIIRASAEAEAGPLLGTRAAEVEEEEEAEEAEEDTSTSKATPRDEMEEEESGEGSDAGELAMEE